MKKREFSAAKHHFPNYPFSDNGGRGGGRVESLVRISKPVVSLIHQPIVSCLLPFHLSD